MRTILVALGLFVVCTAWGFLMNAAMFGASTFQQDAGVALGMGTPVFFLTACGAGVIYYVTRSRTKAFWGWLMLILIVFAVLGVGAAQVSRQGID